MVRIHAGHPENRDEFEFRPDRQNKQKAFDSFEPKVFLIYMRVTTKFVNTTDLMQVKSAITKHTKLIYCETMSNPMEITNIRELSKIAKTNHSLLVVDNTFSSLIFTPAKEGVDVVVHSLTKFINGMSDCVAGAAFLKNYRPMDTESYIRDSKLIRNIS